MKKIRKKCSTSFVINKNQNNNQKKKKVEIKQTVTERNNAFDVFTGRLDMAERITELEDFPLETSKSKEEKNF